MSDPWPVADAAHFVEVSRRTLARWVHDGRLRACERRGVTYIDLDELCELLGRRGPGGRLPKWPTALRHSG